MVRAFALALAAVFCCAPAAYAAPAVPCVDASIALSSLIALTDGHLRDVSGSLQMLAADDGRSGKWEKIEPGLRRAAKLDVPAAFWFALPDGSYWTTLSGKQTANMSDRAFFHAAMAGQVSVGGLVVSRSTNRPVAVVAVPVRSNDNRVIGVLGASVYLDDLSARVKRDMGAGPNVLFFSVDTHGLVGINSNASIIFLSPRTVSDELNGAFSRMISTASGVETYRYNGKQRTVIYRTSPLTGWRYAFGVVH